ncbi:MAG TPA: hypothetical protein VG501_07615, partial [Rhizomicrobium sp.]|nr:hypothetical protein [Rhizomicrobium sp.]
MREEKPEIFSSLRRWLGGSRKIRYKPTSRGEGPMRLSRISACLLSFGAIALFAAGCSKPAPKVSTPASLDELAKQSLATIDG